MMQSDLHSAALSEWMGANVDGFSGSLSMERFAGGQSNPTFRLRTPAGEYVLRKKPPGKLVKGAHAVEREARVMQALGRHGFPVPKVHALCEDTAIIGTPFFIMELVEGRIFWDARFPDVPETQRPAYFEEMNTVIAQLHSIDPDKAGLDDFGKRTDYLGRQIRLWTKQYLADGEAGRDASMDELIEWLPENIPRTAPATIIHGDFRCDNLIFHETEPRILAVLDWELSTIGDPISDFSYHAMMYRMPPDIVAGLAGCDLAAWNIPGEQQYLANYCKRTGHDWVAHWNFYMAFNLFRLAAIFHGIKGRVIRGNASSDEARERVKHFPRLAALALETKQACEARA